ncbi:MAG: hypothetical protein VCC00_03355, partial [Deltaproteobacteria bacterium]
MKITFGKAAGFLATAALAATFLVPAPAEAAGKVEGTITFEGTPPKRKKLRMDADPQCAKQHSETVRSEEVIVDENGGLANVFIYVKTGLEGQEFEAPTEPATINQKGCLYEPHVQGAQIGQPVRFLNSDKTLHN